MAAREIAKLNLILSTRVFSKGIDIPSADCMIDATGLPSSNNVIQRYGRLCRRTESKQHFVFYNICDYGSHCPQSPIAATQQRKRALESTGAKIEELKGGDVQ